jgi:hypothetical protein
MSMGTMLFTFPGAILLIGLQTWLADRGMGKRSIDVLVALFGALASAATDGLKRVVLIVCSAARVPIPASRTKIIPRQLRN